MNGKGSRNGGEHFKDIPATLDVAGVRKDALYASDELQQKTYEEKPRRWAAISL